MAGEPRISVVVPVFNRAELLPLTIESVLNQTVDCWELIVVDDGSTDDLSAALAPYLYDTRVRVVRQENAGRSAARNNGAANARGKLLAFLDSDDLYVPDGLESLLAAFGNDAALGLALGGYDYIDVRGDVIGHRRPWKEGELDLEGWFLVGFGIPASTMVERSWFERVEGYDPSLDSTEDRDLFIRLALADCPMAWVRRTVCRYRKHEGNSDFRMQRDAGIRSFEKLLRDPSCPPTITKRRSEVLSDPILYSARLAARAGNDELVREDLQMLRELDALPTWRLERTLVGPSGFADQIQWLAQDVADACGDDPRAIAGEFDRLALAWGIPRRELDHALAHRRARGFFAALARGGLEEAARLRNETLSLDPRWYAHRTILLFPLRRPLSRVF
jgi:hypothetical protein